MTSFAWMGEVREKLGRKHIFIDRGASVLAVAHADSVQAYAGFGYTKDTLRCATLDNRLGLYLAVYHMPSVGINVDVLITDGEERGNSSAQDFVSDKQYNWIYSFDRTGDDVVLYGYEDDATEDLMTSYGFKVGMGSYSDISELEHLGCKGMNFGCGMYNYHGKDAWADLGELDLNLSLFSNFYRAMAGEHLPHTQTVRYSRYSSWRDWGNYDWRGSYTASVGKSSSVLYGENESRYWKKPIYLDGVLFNYAWEVDRYRHWSVHLQDWIYLDEMDGATTPAGRKILDEEYDRQIKRQRWDEEEFEKIQQKADDEFHTCVGCGMAYSSGYVSILDDEYFCDSCLEDVYRAPRKPKNRLTVFLRECDGCSVMVDEDRLKTWYDSKLCEACYVTVNEGLIGVG